MARKHTQTCAIASALNLFGDRWTLLIIREAFYGARRFGEFLTNTGISRNLLSDRLDRLVEEGILQPVAFADRGTQFTYALTDKGRSLDVVLLALQQWADKHVHGTGQEPVLCFDKETHSPLPDLAIRDVRGNKLTMADIAFQPGPGASKYTRRRLDQLREAEAAD